MSAIIALMILGAATASVSVFTLLFPKRLRLFVWIAVIGFVSAYPFLYKLYPSYSEFQALCNNPERYTVKRVVPVRSVFVDGENSSDREGYQLSKKLNFESADIKQFKVGYSRIEPSPEWHTPACQTACANLSPIPWEQNCLPSCITKTPIQAPEFEHKFDHQLIERMEDRLVESRVVVHEPDGKQLAISSGYTYFQYGRGWARLLGASSGTPPSIECDHDPRLWALSFLKPITSKP